MRELVQLVYIVGPSSPSDRALLAALASFTAGDGRLCGWRQEDLARITQLPLQSVRRHLKRLDAEDWIFIFGRGADEESVYLVDVKKICCLALSAGVWPNLTEWAEKQLGVVSFPKAVAAREVMYK